MDIEQGLKNLPDSPGVYLMFNTDNQIIYVGKAKNLKNRVSSYFRKNTSHTNKVKAMVKNIVRFEYIIVNTEFEALVLECNLIKQYRPYYNILLKDDKTYPYIKITDEDYPRILLTRRIENDNAHYFGPYINSRVIYETMDFIKSIFNIRSCKKSLPRDIGKGRPCLNYQINKCSAPCCGYISQKEYKAQFDKIVDFLNGNHFDIVNDLQNRMTEAANDMNFELAAKYRDKINAIKHIQDKQRITSTNLGNKDIIAIADIGIYACIVLMIVRDGRMLNREHFIIKNNDKEDIKTLLTDFVKQHYSISDFIPNKLILQYEIYDIELIERWLSEKCGCKINVSVAVKGENKRLVEMAEKNALENLKLHILNIDSKQKKLNDLTYQIKNTFGLDKLPMRIEAYDISNISGADSVGVCVVFENCVSKKSEYRIFNIRSVSGADDYESIRETLYRRLEHGVYGDNRFKLPDLILIDGGRGHVKAAKGILDFYKLDIPLFGMVKDDKHRTRGVTTVDKEIYIKRTDEIFRFITQIQDETHRFAITSFHKKHKNAAFKSELLNIKGVGEAKKNRLLKEFKTIAAVKNATIDELSSVIDRNTSVFVYEYFHDQN